MIEPNYKINSVVPEKKFVKASYYLTLTKEIPIIIVAVAIFIILEGYFFLTSGRNTSDIVEMIYYTAIFVILTLAYIYLLKSNAKRFGVKRQFETGTADIHEEINFYENGIMFFDIKRNEHIQIYYNQVKQITLGDKMVLISLDKQAIFIMRDDITYNITNFMNFIATKCPNAKQVESHKI